MADTVNTILAPVAQSSPSTSTKESPAAARSNIPDPLKGYDGSTLYTHATSSLEFLSQNLNGQLNLQNPVDVFLDDMLLRLELWAADIDLDILKWADKVVSIRATLPYLFIRLNKAVRAFKYDYDSINSK